MDDENLPPDAADPEPTGVRPVDLRDYVDFSEDAPRRIRVYATTDLALDLWCVEPHQATPVLHYPEQAVTYTVIGGRAWFVTDDGDVGLDPMGAILVPPGTVHGIDNRAPDPLIVQATSSPPSQHGEDRPVVDTAAAVRRDPDHPGRFRRIADALLGPRAPGP